MWFFRTVQTIGVTTWRIFRGADDNVEVYASIRSDPRFADLLRRMNLQP
jgi:hypothetical protein